jgi:hypothetical protein
MQPGSEVTLHFSELGFHGFDYTCASKDVALDGESISGHAACPVVAFLASESGSATLSIDQAYLALLAPGIIFEQARKGLGCRKPVCHQIQPIRTIRRIGKGLGSDCSCSRPCPRDNGAYSRKFGGNSDPPFLGL